MCHAISRCCTATNQKINDNLSPGQQALIATVILVAITLFQMSIKYFGAFNLSPGEMFAVNFASLFVTIPAALVILFKGREPIMEGCMSCFSWCGDRLMNI